jgi:hypothetical protein
VKYGSALRTLRIQDALPMCEGRRRVGGGSGTHHVAVRRMRQPAPDRSPLDAFRMTHGRVPVRRRGVSCDALQRGSREIRGAWVGVDVQQLVHHVR